MPSWAGIAKSVRQWRVLAAIVLCATLAACQTAPVALTWKMPDGVSTAQVNGYPMAYVEQGSGPTIVLVHGVPFDYRYWAPQLRAYSSQYRVVAPSLRHFYPEPWDGERGGFSLRQHADDLAQFIARMNPPVYLLGHSYGGLVAYEMARANPALVKKLILADPPLLALAAQPVDQSGELLEKLFLHFNIDMALEVSLDSLVGPAAWKQVPESRRQEIRQNAWTVLGVERDKWPDARCEDVKALKMPVLFITGETTSRMFKATMAGVRKCAADARIVEIPRAGHEMSRSNPAAFDAAVTGFFQ